MDIFQLESFSVGRLRGRVSLLRRTSIGARWRPGPSYVCASLGLRGGEINLLQLRCLQCGNGRPGCSAGVLQASGGRARGNFIGLARLNGRPQAVAPQLKIGPRAARWLGGVFEELLCEKREVS